MKKRKIIFVPTPGQTEQEYIAQKFSAENKCVFMMQKDFNLNDALSCVELNEGFSKDLNLASQLKEAVSELLSIC